MDISIMHSNSYNHLSAGNRKFVSMSKQINLEQFDAENKTTYIGTIRGIGEEQLTKIIEKTSRIYLKPPTELQFTIHEKTNRISFKIINSESKEVIKEVPSEKILDMVAKIWELVGLFVDEKA